MSTGSYKFMSLKYHCRDYAIGTVTNQTHLFTVNAYSKCFGMSHAIHM